MSIVYKDFENLTKRLQAMANPKTKDWWNNYIKDGAPFLGVKMADIRTVVHDWYEEELKDQWHGEQLVSLARDIFFLESSEHKLAGILLIRDLLIPRGTVRHLPGSSGVSEPGWKTQISWRACEQESLSGSHRPSYCSGPLMQSGRDRYSTGQQSPACIVVP